MLRILLGGIPLGCDNIGDEAIIACVVKMLKESLPGVALTVATADAGTAQRLGVAVVPPFGFLAAGFSGFAETVSRHDAYVWCGATGLSDYPHVGLELLERAQKAGVPTFVWGVGMDDELNPVFFRVHGKRRALLRVFGLVPWYERRLQAKLAQRISAILPRCRGVWLRDPQSVAMLASLGFSGAGIAADTAILFPPCRVQDARCSGGATLNPECGTRNAKLPTLGLCISTQRQVADLDGLKGVIAAVRAAGAKIIGIPMNPKTDRMLLERLGVECITGTTPEAVTEAAAQCDVVLSSRLHLLILAANAGTPILGIARGSKLANWLANFNRTVEGDVYSCDWKRVADHVLAALKDRGDWDAVRAVAYERLNVRLDKARDELVTRLVALRQADCACHDRNGPGETGANHPLVSVLVRAHNDEAFIERTLRGIFAQKVDFPFEVIVCDDASTDRTREIAARFPVRFFERPEGAYTPGRTLNALVRAARGDLVVFNNSDAIPLDGHWLAALVRPLGGVEAPLPVFTFANQLPRPTAQALVRKDSERAFGDGKVQATWRFFFSLASSATWRRLVADTPFDETIQYSEDVEWAWRNSRRAENPVKIVYCPDARVEHSHNYTWRELVRRFRGEGAADRIIFGDRPSFLREMSGAVKEVLRDWRYLATRPRDWCEFPAAPFRRFIQRVAHWQGMREGTGAR